MRKLVLPDENEFVVPEVWRTALHRRRGGLPGPDIPVPPDAAEAYRAWLTSERTVKHRKELLPPGRGVTLDPVLLAEGTEYLRGWLGPGDPAEPTPRAAAVGVLMTLAYARTGNTEAFPAVDAWISRYGIVFAACAAAELAVLVKEEGSAFWTHDPAFPDYSSSWRSEDQDSLAATARAVRTRLATAADDEYHRVVRELGGYRISPEQRIITSYLAPTEVAWVDEDCAADRPGTRTLRGLLVLAASTVGHLELLQDRIGDRMLGYHRVDVVGTILDGVGPAAAPILVGPFYLELLRLNDRDKFRYRHRLGVDGLRLLAAAPTDEAFRLLCRSTIGAEHARLATLLKSGALTRFPVRALRVLHELESAPLSTHENEHWKRQDVSNPDEPSIYTDLLGRQVLADPRLPAAAADLLPSGTRDRVREIVATGGAGLGAGLAGLLDRHDAQSYRKFLGSADDEKRAIGALASIRADDAFGRLVDRVDRNHVRPALLTAAKRDPERALRGLLAKATGGTVAELLRNHVLAHPDGVAEALSALDEPTRARAEAILGDVTSPGTPVAEGATPPVLAGPPRGSGGKAVRAPDLPDWLVLPALPAVALRDGGEALSRNAVRQLCALLAVSKVAAAHAGIEEVRALCEPHDLAAFAWAVFVQWRAAHYPPKSALAMTALALLGDDSVASPLAELFPSWAKGSSGRVRTGMDVLAALGTEDALRQLHRLARKAKTRGFRRLAEERLDDVARARGLGPEQLADRLVPDLGLDADARTTLDYGRGTSPSASTPSSPRTSPTSTARRSPGCPARRPPTTPSWRRPPSSGTRR
ncbi:hypothetical protein [Umezawaea sp. Da 62-37]|uniref:hypothetical protein n=1 Tax=Umezawaea sp. Da 62-37 TaxID=3075927 RepID=UPI0028F74382|nr:hypothetical protein [Umezawaea sp. Da 62-37]WNV86069.1 hypothetical protein RM788_49490 [Umezawaea sp. Da 62-37]